MSVHRISRVSQWFCGQIFNSAVCKSEALSMHLCHISCHHATMRVDLHSRMYACKWQWIVQAGCHLYTSLFLLVFRDYSDSWCSFLCEPLHTASCEGIPDFPYVLTSVTVRSAFLWTQLALTTCETKTEQLEAAFRLHPVIQVCSKDCIPWSMNSICVKPGGGGGGGAPSPQHILRTCTQHVNGHVSESLSHGSLFVLGNLDMDLKYTLILWLLSMK